MIHSYISFIIILVFLLPVLFCTTQLASAQTTSIYTCVKENKVAFSNTNKINAFTQKLLSGVVNMTLGDTSTLRPQEVTSFYQQIGLVRVTNIIEVNDSFTNVYLQFSNRETANKVLEASNTQSWNPVKSTKIILATNVEPPTPSGESRHVLFGGIVAVATVFSAGLSAFIVRRLAIRKHDKANRAAKDMENLESQLLAEQLKQLGKGGVDTDAPAVSGAVAGKKNSNNSRKGGGITEVDMRGEDPYSPVGTQEFPGPFDNNEEALMIQQQGSRRSSNGGSRYEEEESNANMRRSKKSSDQQRDKNGKRGHGTSTRNSLAPTESDVYSDYGENHYEEDERRSGYSRRSSRGKRR